MTIGILNKAIQSAQKSRMYPYKVGCVIFKGKRILACGHNQKRTYTPRPLIRYKKFPDSLHAELHAIMQVHDKTLLNGASILVVRVTMGERISLAKPCVHCMKSILHFGIKEIYYSTSTGEIVLERTGNPFPVHVPLC